MMNKYGLVLIGCTLGLAGCSQQRVPEDWQLAALLKRADATASGADAIDAQAVGCLRAWSGDADLAKGLSVLVAGEDGRKRCRERLDGWLADATRNPAKFTFEEISAPDVARRARGLLDAADVATAKPGQDGIPAVLHQAEPAMTQAKRRAPPADSADLEAALVEAESLCHKVGEAAAAPAAAASLVRFAPYCDSRLRRLRAAVQAAEFNGRSASQDQVASARNLATSARNLLAQSSK